MISNVNKKLKTIIDIMPILIWQILKRNLLIIVMLICTSTNLFSQEIELTKAEILNKQECDKYKNKLSDKVELKFTGAGFGSNQITVDLSIKESANEVELPVHSKVKIFLNNSEIDATKLLLDKHESVIQKVFSLGNSPENRLTVHDEIIVQFRGELNYQPVESGNEEICEPIEIKKSLTKKVTAPKKIILKDSSINYDNGLGCHGQGVKWNGHRWYTTCEEYGDNHVARAMVHDNAGNLLCSIDFGEKFDHPSGLDLYTDKNGVEWAYTGFTQTSGFNESIILGFRYADGPLCESQVLNFVQGKVNENINLKEKNPANVTTIDDDIGLVVGFVPESQMCNKAYTPNIYIAKDFISDDYTFCNAEHNVCEAEMGDSDAADLWEGLQDCFLYYKKGWHRVCQTIPFYDGYLRVFTGDELDFDDTHKLEFRPPGSERNDGGVGYWNGFVVKAAHAEQGGCGSIFSKKPCTTNDADKGQLVTITELPLENDIWPAGGCEE